MGLKIVHIISGLGNGGAEGVLARLCCSDISEDEHLVICLTNFDHHTNALRKSGIPVFLFNFKIKHLIIYNLWKLFQLLRNVRPDIIQSWMYHADIVSSIFGAALRRPVIWNVRHSNIGRNQYSLRLIRFFCAILSWYVPKYIIVCSRSSINVHSSAGYNSKKFVYIPNGFGPSWYNIAVERFNRLPEERISHEPFVVGMLARYNQQKDHRNLLLAFQLACARLSVEMELRLAGPNVDHKNLDLVALIDELDLSSKVTLLGPVEEPELFYRSLSVHILSSAYGEGFPNVVAEALISGCPCIVTDVGDAAEIVGDSGWVVPPKQYKALGAAIIEAYQSISEADWLEKRFGYITWASQEFSLENMVVRYRKVWRDAKLLSE